MPDEERVERRDYDDEGDEDEDQEDLEEDDEDEEGIEGEIDEDEDEQIIPNSHPPVVPEEGTYIDALNEAGVDQERIDQLQQSKFKPNYL